MFACQSEREICERVGDVRLYAIYSHVYVYVCFVGSFRYSGAVRKYIT